MIADECVRVSVCAQVCVWVYFSDVTNTVELYRKIQLKYRETQRQAYAAKSMMCVNTGLCIKPQLQKEI